MNSRPVAIHATATPRRLARTLIDHSISGVPVIDAERHVIGVASRADLLQWCVKGGLGFGAGDLLVSLAEGGNGTRLDPVDLGIVADFMSACPKTIGSEESLEAAAAKMSDARIHRLVVVDSDGHLTGIITSLDLLGVYPKSNA